MTTYKLKVTTKRDNLNIRSGPGLSYRVTNPKPYQYGLPKGTEITANEYQAGWYKHQYGWSSGQYLQVLSKTPDDTVPQKPTPPPPPPPLSTEMSDLLKSLLTDLKYKSNELDDMNYVFGMPFQFSALTDPRPDKFNYGRSYMSTIIADLPLLVITPGRAEFMKDFSKDDKNRVVKELVDATRGETSQLTELMYGESQGRYYHFVSDYEQYMEYVNNMCRLSAIYLNIHNKKPFGSNTKYKDMHWHTLKGDFTDKKPSAMKQFLSGEPGVCFFIDAKQSSYGESSSNSTDSSMIEGLIGRASDAAKEITFLLDRPMSGDTISETSKFNYENAVNKVLSAFKGIDKGVVKMVTDHGKMLASGANIAFPEVWKDSSYGKNYSIEIKLVSPYGDPESIYLNILVPLFHIIALSFPRQVGRSGYMHPFIIRAFCKGWFNCNMGVIDSISIKKGSQDGWSVDGMPTEVDVSISIKDLYSVLGISKSGDMSTFGNIEFLDFIGTMSGANINKPDIQRKFTMYTAWAKNKVTDVPTNLKIDLQESIIGLLNKFMK